MIVATQMIGQGQVPLSRVDQAAFVRYMEAMAKKEDFLPTDFAELTKLLREAEHQALMFFVAMRTWDFNLEMDVYYLSVARDQSMMGKVQTYR